MSYTHLSRIENDSIVPSADSLVKIADALGGDLNLMLDKRSHMPIDGGATHVASVPSRRRFRRKIPGSQSDGDAHLPSEGEKSSSKGAHPTVADAAELLELIQRLDGRQRRLVQQLILELAEGVDGPR